MEKSLELLGVTDDATSIKLVSFQLRDSAEAWWRYIKDSRKDTGTTWAEFSELFLQRYFPDVIKDMKRMEFMKFEQGNLSVSDYETRFTAMSKFAKEMVSTETLKCRKFEAGLIDTIRPSVVVHAHTSYRKVVDAALLMEREIGSMSQTTDRGRQTRAGAGSVSVPHQ